MITPLHKPGLEALWTTVRIALAGAGGGWLIQSVDESWGTQESHPGH